MSGNYHELSDTELVRKVKEEDRDAFTELSGRYFWLIRAKAAEFEGASSPCLLYTSYETARTREEVSRDLLADLNKYENCVFAAVKGNYGQEVEALFTCAVFIEVPSELRSARVRERSYQKFGDRIFPGGDLYEKEKRFFEMVDRRSAKDVEEWLSAVRLPTIRVDGTKTKEYNAALIVEALRKKETSSVFKL